MGPWKNAILLALVCSLLLGSALANHSPQQKSSAVKRARRPTFTEKDWDGIFFKNLFTEALSGERPDSLATNEQPEVVEPGNMATQPAMDGAAGWSSLIDRTILEDEVKRLQIVLNEQVTTPAKFSTEHNQARQTFSMLSMLFAVVKQYEQDVRWKEHAASAQKAFARAAANARTGSQQSYANARRCKEDLLELVRGGSFPTEPEITEIKDWAEVVDRGPIMQRLEYAMQERLKEATSSENAFRGDAETVLHEANLIAVMSRVLKLPEMLDADDDSYTEYADQMLAAAQAMTTAVKTNDYQGVNASLNMLRQSCDACHGDWR